MKQFDHPHIIKLIGVCTDDEFYIVMELAAYGEVITLLLLRNWKKIQTFLYKIGGLSISKL